MKQNHAILNTISAIVDVRHPEHYAKPCTPRTICIAVRSASNGFTLVELMIVVTIMGIIAGLAVNSAFDRSKLELENSAKAVARTFWEAKLDAKRTGRTTAVKVFPNRVEAFYWADLNSNGLVEWTDNNGDGDFDNGEGEVVQSIKTNYVGKAEGILGSTSGSGRVFLRSPTSGNIQTMDTGLNFICFRGGLPPAPDPFAVRILPEGFMFATDHQLCTSRLFAEHVDGRTCVIQVDAGAQVRKACDT